MVIMFALFPDTVNKNNYFALNFVKLILINYQNVHKFNIENMWRRLKSMQY